MLFPLSFSMLHARDSVVGIRIPISISLPASLFTRSVKIPWLTLSHIACKACVWCCITEWAPRYLSVTRSDKSQSWSILTQRTPSEIPAEHLYSYPVTLWRLIQTRYSSGASELYDLMVIGMNTWHAENNSNKMTRSHATFIVWVLSITSFPLSSDKTCLWPRNLDHLWSTR